ncbi:MAG: exopolyphosphatase [Lachnospiraceae bacterium]|jgi:exopolyphosphatase/guanosine-5'-triphosphate,3'-diphosphate pyrophosphatase|nr:exopolyphosphatase [Lachnospiraceae bacterium]
MAIQTFAAIDVGSFEVELGIYEISNKFGIRSVDHVRHVIALGRDTYGHGKIGYELVEELCQVLKEFAVIMKGYKVQAYKAYATSALRDAKNNQIILDQILVRTGIDVKLIENSEQRFLSYKAIASKDQEFNNTIQKGTAIVDVGFGSMQISLFDKDSLVSTQNLPLGTLRLRELIAKVPAGMEVHSHLIRELVDNELFTFRKIYLKDREIKNLIGIGDNALYMFKQILNETRSVSDKMTAEDVNHFYDAMFKLSQHELEDLFGISERYVEVMLPSAVIYRRIMEITGAEQFWLPGIRLCDGIAAEYGESIRQVKFKHSFENDILAASRNMAKRYKCHNSHNQVLEQFVMEIFDAMRRFHGLTARDRLLLRIAVMLHACGKFISIKDANECAYNIIMATEIIGLSRLERELIANVVRYNIRDFDYGHVELEAQIYKDSSGIISAHDITIKIAKFTAILRLANSMDRSHQQKLSGCKMSIHEDELIITTDYPGDITLEQMSFVQKADFFEEIFGIRPVLKQKRRV